MKRRWKLFSLALSWVFLSIGTSILIILTQPLLSSAQKSEAPSSQQSPAPVIIPHVIVEPTSPTTEIPKTSTPEESPVPVVVPDSTESESTPPSGETTEKKPGEATDTQKLNITTESELSPEEVARRQKLIEADRLYLGGQTAAAEKLYREAKEPFTTVADTQAVKEAITDPAQLPPGGQVFWREAEAGIASQLETRIFVPLQLLVEKYPEFIPGQIRYAEALKQYDRQKEALQLLEAAATRYPNQPDLIKAKVQALADAERWMEASLAARQFALINPDSPEAPELKLMADDNLKRYKSHTRAKVRGNTITNIVTGALGYALTGSLFGPFSALDSTILMLRGENAVGESVANQAKKQLKVIEDPLVVDYVNEIGQKLATVSGRQDFDYEFYVTPLEELNAFALPGGKIFVNAGAIAKTDSEAELAGLIGHELSHAILSHGFQLVTQGNLISNLTQYVPFGGTVGQIFTFSYSREMERQADELGTRLIVATGYAADGLRNLMVTLDKQQKFNPPSWLSSHPGGNERVRYLEELISRNRYNRYAYEGVARHLEVQEKVKQIMKEQKERQERKKKRRNR